MKIITTISAVLLAASCWASPAQFAGVIASAPSSGSAPSAPTSLSSTVTSSSFTPSWTAGVGATSHTSEYGTTASYGTSGPTTSGTSITGLTADTQYHWRACAVNAYGTTCAADQTATTSASGGDSTIVFYYNAEAKSAAPQKGSGTLTYDSNITIASGITGMQGNALFANAGWNAMYIPSSGNIDPSVGTMGFYMRRTANSVAALVSNGDPDTSPFWAFVSPLGDTTHTFNYASSQTQNTVELTSNTTYYIEIAWDRSGNKKSVRVNGGAWQETTGLAAGTPTIANVVIGTSNGTNPTAYFDQIIISNVYQKDIYAIRNNTSF